LAGKRPIRGLLSRLVSAGGALLSRDIAVLTNAIAFNFLLCLFPLLLVVAGFAQRLPAGSRTSTALVGVISELIPFARADLATSMKTLARYGREMEILSLLLIAWGSSGIFMPMEMALNKVWGGRPHRTFWKSRLLAFVMTLLGGLLAIASVTLTVATRTWAKGYPLLAGVGNKVSALLLTSLLFFLIYRLIPDADVRSGVAVKAALWAAVAWEGAKYAFVIQLGRMNLQAFYGPLAFAVSLVLWAYVSSLIVVFGALMAPIPGRPARGGRAAGDGRG
jgi:membrane protein/epoxyqueuosine reductase